MLRTIFELVYALWIGRTFDGAIEAIAEKRAGDMKDKVTPKALRKAS